MKYFSFKVLILGLFLPPVLYIITLQGIENYLYNIYLHQVEEIYIGDTDALLDGLIEIDRLIARNIETFIYSRKAVKWGGADLKVIITTNDNRILYPSAYQENSGDDNIPYLNSMETARENYKILNEGLNIKMALEVGYNSRLSIAILFFYLFLCGMSLYEYFLIVNRRISEAEKNRANELIRLSEKEKASSEKLVLLENERSQLTKKIEEIRTDLSDEKKRASLNEDEMINEIVSLEKKLEDNFQIALAQEAEIEILREKLLQFEKKTQSKKKEKSQNVTEKRFKTLYKNIHLDERALSGYDSLTEEMKIKCEEVIHLLNDDAGQVVVKRKVFNKKNSLVFFEVRFAYKGRLYFSKDKAGKINIIVIGTKNTQNKDLEFLDNY